jgi:tetratricopeptide (TPR) repeat protein
MSQETTTQLADNRPQFDCALRVALPGNVPQRLAKKGRDELIRANAFSPAAFSSGRKTFEILAAACQKSSSSIISEEVENVSHLLDSKIIDSISRDADADIKTTIRDLSVLALSSRRANQKDVEATAYLSLGVIHDNLGSYHAAIENYMQYLQICQEVNDIMGSALACNCLGVDYMTLVNSNSDGGTVEGVKQTENLVSDLNRAIEFHQKHLEIGPDDGGRFVANTNLGLCYGT